jgi:hypothetical protein
MEMGKVLIIAGGVLLTFGVLLVILPKGMNPLGWFGKLPGDLSYSSDGTFVFIPITSMVVVSVVLSVALWVFRLIFPPS